MEILGVSFYLILGIALWVLFALWPALWAKKKGYSFILFLLLAWITSFLLTLFVVALLKNKNESQQDRTAEKEVKAILDNE